jgi:hypothetical protein
MRKRAALNAQQRSCPVIGFRRPQDLAEFEEALRHAGLPE